MDCSMMKEFGEKNNSRGIKGLKNFKTFYM